MKFLITGANGFVATHFLASILPSDDIILHVRNSEKVKKLERAGWHVLIGKKGFETVSSSVGCVVHLAGAAGGSMQECIDGNIITTLDIVRAMERASIPNIIFLSGAAVYGNITLPASESVSPSPTTPYGITKYVAECIIEHSVEQNRIEGATIFRSNNIYGPGSDHGMVSNFIAQAKTSSAIRVDGDGSQVREPVYIDDVITAIHASIKTPPRGYHVYNISGNEAVTLRELVETHISKAIGKKMLLELSGKPAGLPHTLRLDITKASRELLWTPKTQLQEGLAKTFEF